MRYYVSWKTTGYYRKDSLKLAACCPVSGCWLLVFLGEIAEYWKHFVVRFDDVHAFGYNSAAGEPIWMKFGTL